MVARTETPSAAVGFAFSFAPLFIGQARCRESISPQFTIAVNCLGTGQGEPRVTVAGCVSIALFQRGQKQNHSFAVCSFHWKSKPLVYACAVPWMEHSIAFCSTSGMQTFPNGIVSDRTVRNDIVDEVKLNRPRDCLKGVA
jgi:hypothetical protein